VTAIGLATVLSLAAVTTTTTAAADLADSQLVSANPLDNTPRVLDGRVQAIVQVGDLVVVGGTFSQVREATPNAPIVGRSGLFAFDPSTGVISTTFNPVLAANTGETPAVDAVVPAPGGAAVYVGGNFRTVNGSGPARLQLVSLADGTRVSSFANRAFNSRVFDVKLVGDQVIAAGSFTTVGGVERRGIASLDATTGALTDKVAVPFTGTAAGFGTTTVRKIDVTPAGDRLVAVGNFSLAAGQSRMQVAMLDLAGPTAVLADWRTSRFGGQDCSTSFDTYLRDIDFAPDGSFFVIVTTGGWGGTRLCDTATRWETYASGEQTYSWVNYTGGDTFWSVEVTGPVAYVGGHFRWLNNTLTRDGSSAGAGAISREGLAALDTRNGLPFSWNPTRTRGVGVFDFHVTQSALWAGSDTAVWAGERRDRLAAFPWTGGLALPNDRLGTVPGDVVQLDADAVAGSDVTARYLTGAAAPVTTTLAGGGVNWADARGAVMIDGTVYSGWADGTLRRQSFDGSALGAQSNVPLSGGSFASDLASSTQRVSSMFFDPRTGRLYYTMASSKKPNGQSNNNGGLFYRDFTPESGVVGPVRVDTLRAASLSAIGADTIRGAFLSGDWLHYVTSSGELRMIQFSASGFVGTSQSVNATADWRAKGLFLSTARSSQAPNESPTAAYTQSCLGLTCTFDASSSTDPDGTVVTYAWDFGDGSASDTGMTPGHTFPTGGSYPVTLTVTDDDGAAVQVQTNVSVTPVESQVAFRDASRYQGGQLRRPSWTLPSSIQDGDTVVMAVTGHLTADPGAVRDENNVPLDGWSEVADIIDDGMRTVIYAKTAVPADAGRTVSVEWLDGTGTSVSVRTFAATAVYSGVDSVSPVQTATETSASSVFAHTTPGATVPDTGDWVVSFWSDRSSATTDWTSPPGQVDRVEGTSALSDPTSTAVRVSGLLTDDGGPAAGGPRVGLTATANGKATAAAMATLVLESK
jgi:PKD repeat protein